MTDVGPDTAAGIAARIRAVLAEAGDPVRAADQQRYMKSQLPYYGVTMTELRRLLRPVLADFHPADRSAWEGAVRSVWDGAGHREERYAALSLARHRSARRWQDPATLSLYRHLVVTGAWWDTVDEVASHLVGGVLAAHRVEVTPTILTWSLDRDLWLRRTSVLAQLRHGTETDTELLRRVIEANAEDDSFWLRKAIGWALRQYARTDPDWVRAEVDRLGPRLSGLSRREATKHL